MKKLIAIVTALVAYNTAFGVEQYFSAINQRVGAGVEMTGNLELFIKLDGMASLPQGVSGFGFYKLDGATTPSANALKSVDVEAMLRDGYTSLGEFKAGDEVVFWMKTENGYIYSGYYGDKGNLRDAAYVTNNGTNNVTIAMEPGLNPGPGYQPYKNVDYATDFVFVVTDVNPGGNTPVGQPLPGVAAGILIGTGTLAGIRRLGKKRAGR